MIQLFIFCIFGFLISVIDWKHHRIPNEISAILFASLILSTLLLNSELIDAGFTFALMFLAIFFTLFLVSRQALGFGDVKYAISCGFLIGVLAPKHWLLTIWLMFILAGTFGIIATLAGKAKLGSTIAFAPFMTFAVILVSLNSLH